MTGILTELNGVRNILAHGHFDQDPYEGTYELVSRRRKSLTARRLKISMRTALIDTPRSWRQSRPTCPQPSIPSITPSRSNI